MHGPSRGGGSSFGGGGGSSFGGESSNGFSFNNSGSSFSGGVRPVRPPRQFHMFGRTLVLTSGKGALLIFLIFAFIISCFTCFFGVSGYRESSKMLAYDKEDEIGFTELIQKANDGEEGYYIKTINNVSFERKMVDNIGGETYYNCYVYETTDVKLLASYYLTYDEIEYFQIYYEFSDEDREVSDYTYASFSFTDILNMRTFKVAYQFNEENFVDSINANFSMETCMEHLDRLDSNKSMMIMMIVSIVIMVVIISVVVTVIVVAIKKAKKDSDLKEEQIRAEIDKTQAETDLVKDTIKKKNRFCAYCGNPIPEGSDICPACGSRLPKDNE